MKQSSKVQKLIQSSSNTHTPKSSSPTKFASFIDVNKTNIKFIHHQNSPTKLKRYQRTKTHLKCYQKQNRKVTESLIKQKIESIKPVTFNQHEQSQFVIESAAKNIEKSKEFYNNNDDNASSFHSPCIGLINPMYINVKCNPKRLTYSCQLPRDQQQSETIFNKKKFQRNSNMISESTHNRSKINYNRSQSKEMKNSQNLYFRIVSEMNDYFSTMKLASFKNNKTQMLTKRNLRAQSQKRTLQQEKKSPQISKKQKLKNDPQQDNLNIIGLRPRTSGYQRIDRNLFEYPQLKRNDSTKKSQKESLSSSKFCQSQQFIPNFTPKQSQEKRYEFALCDNVNSLVINNEIISHGPINHLRHQKIRTAMKPMTQQSKRNSPQKVAKKIVFKGFCFGEINLSKHSQQEIYRLKILYYKDLLWKNSWNVGIKYLPAVQGMKFYVGKGNNSKLIKNLMTKRWWWSLQQKQENSQFIWTQLKIYSIYEKQTNLSISPLNEKGQQISVSQIKLPQSEKNIESNDKKIDFQDNSALILNESIKNRWKSYIIQSQNIQREKKIAQQTLQQKRKNLFNGKLPLFSNPSKITNHLEFSRAIGNKKALYKVMMTYFQKVKKYSIQEIYVPLTYHITAGLEDEEYLKFLSEYYRRSKSQSKTCWIVKPGELTNRGNGIRYCKDLNEIKPIVKKKQAHPNGTLKTFLIQSYIDSPLLYKGRKFDIRHYIMISSINGKLRGYFYQGGYIRTTSYKYKLDDNSPAVHLTNDAVQKYCKDYGRYEKGNKLSYQEFDEYMKEKCSQNCGEKKQNGNTANQKKVNFFETILPQIKQISTDVIHAAYYFIDPSRRQCNFQIFGLDIMIDQQLKCYLIQVNTNPCLQLSSPVLRNVIPEMLDNALSLTLDCCYPPPEKQMLTNYHKKYKYPQSTENKFEIVFDQDLHGQEITKIYQKQGIFYNEVSGIGDDDQNFQSCEQDNEDF